MWFKLEVFFVFRRLKSKSGYALVWILSIILVISFLSMALVSSTVISSNSTKYHHDYQQAYFTAKSAANAVAEYIIRYARTDGGVDVLMDSLVSAQPIENTVNNLGKYMVDVERYGSRYAVVATAKYNGKSATVTANLVKTMPGAIPTDYAIYVDSTTAKNGGFKGANVTGDVYVNGDLEIFHFGIIDGNLIINGQTEIQTHMEVTGNVFSFGNFDAKAQCNFNGDIFSKGDILTQSNQTVIKGNAYADGSLILKSGTKVWQNAVIRNDVSTGTLDILGSLQYGGTSSSSPAVGGSTYKSDIPLLDLSRYVPQTLMVINPPEQDKMPQLYIPLVVTGSTISTSGTITSDTLQSLKATGASTITIDANGTKDIVLLLNNTAMDLTDLFNIEVKKSISSTAKNVYLYMTGDSSITIGNDKYFGMDPRGSNPRLFIIGNGTQTVTLKGRSELNAVVYIPNGSVYASGDLLLNETYKFVGSCIAKYVEVFDGSPPIAYSAPKIQGTPLTQLGGGWYIYNWR